MRGQDSLHSRRGFDLVVVVGDEPDGDLLQGVGVVEVSRQETSGGVVHGDRFAKTVQRNE